MSSLYIDLSSFYLFLVCFCSLLSSSRFFFKLFEAGALLSLARNSLFPEPCTEVKRATSSRQARAMHSRPFSWSVLLRMTCCNSDWFLLLKLDTRVSSGGLSELTALHVINMRKGSMFSHVRNPMTTIFKHA